MSLSLRTRLAGAWLLFCVAAVTQSEPLELHLPVSGEASQHYYLSLLQTALRGNGDRVTLAPLPDMPNPRISQLLEHGDIDVYWFLRTPERDQRFLRVDIPLTEGMIGRRILLVPPGKSEVLRSVRTLDDLKATGLVAGLASGWYDNRIWEHNGLPASEQQSSTRNLLRLISLDSRGLDYMPRGATEVLDEAKQHPALTVDPYLVLSYPNDFYFYVSPKKPALQAKLTRALRQAEKSGRKHQLFEASYGPALRQLKLPLRREIRLTLPAG